MAKKKKKRNKPYRGEDAAAPDRPVVRRYEAEDRGALKQWWHEKKRTVKIVGITSGIGLIIIWLVSEIIRLVA